MKKLTLSYVGPEVSWQFQFHPCNDANTCSFFIPLCMQLVLWHLVYTKTIIHLSVADSGYLPALR